MRILVLSAAATLVLGLAAASAQAPLLTLTSPSPAFDGRFGSSIVFAGDLTGDGVSEIAVGAPRESTGSSPTQSGRVHLFDGASGALLRTLLSPTEGPVGSFGHVIVNVGDFNNDGFDDLLVGAPLEVAQGMAGAGKVHFFSGETGAPFLSVWSLTGAENGLFGIAAAVAGDVDGDGLDDLIIGAPGESPQSGPSDAGRAHLISRQGTWLRQLAALSPGAGAQFGAAVAGIGDVNQDGRADLVVGAPGAGDMSIGLAHLIDGASGGEMVTMSSPLQTNWGRFGRRVASLGDVDGDGLPNILLSGAGDSAPGAPAFAGSVSIRAAGGTEFVTLRSPAEQANGAFGSFISGAGDITGDGVEDVLVGAIGEGPSHAAAAGRVHVFSGAHGHRRTTLSSPNLAVNGHFGTSLAGGVDLDGDGIPEILIGADGENSPGVNRSGRAYAFAGGALVDAKPMPSVDELSLRVEPNPVIRRATIWWSAPLGTTARVTVVDVLGREIAVLATGASNGSDRSVAWTVGNAPPGVYLIRLETETASYTETITLLR